MLVVDNPDQFREKLREKYCEILKNKKYATNLEIGVFNFAIKQSKAKKIVKKWDNVYFTHICIVWSYYCTANNYYYCHSYRFIS